MAKIQSKVYHDDDGCKVILWEGVCPGDDAEAVECKNFAPGSVQVEADWMQGGRVVVEGSCGGRFVPDVSFTCDGVKKVTSDYLSVRPEVCGPAGTKANIFLMGRR